MKISAKAGDHVYEVLVERRGGEYVVEIDGNRHVVDARKVEADFYSILTGGRSYEVSVQSNGDGYEVRHGAAMQRVTLYDPGRQARDAQKHKDGPEQVVSSMPGKVVRLLVAEGDEVEEGQGLVVVEAMKMENEIEAGKAGKVRTLAVEAGQSVEGGAVLAVIE